MNLGVAISTTGHEHRLQLLVESVRRWNMYLPEGAPIFVTVDGSLADVDRVSRNLWRPATVLRVGRPSFAGDMDDDHRIGVAANKNTGLEALVDAGCTEMFLCDDDTWPLSIEALRLHTELGLAHSLVCWGRHRAPAQVADRIGGWSWPRGAAMYVEDPVLDAVGGFIEDFGHGGHEHVEWSRRIHQAGFTPVPYPSPDEYIQRGGRGSAWFWHAEDQQMKGESIASVVHRRRKLTSINRAAQDWKHMDDLFKARDGDTSFVPYRAADNGRASATMSSHSGA